MSVTHTNRKSPRARRRAGVRNLARRVDGRSYAPACVSPRRKCNESWPQTQAVVTILARRFHRNQQYSIVALTNGGGTVTERYAYDAYGTPAILDASGTTLTTSADNNRYTYTGREFDEALGLYHYRARMYDSVAGRFCSRDPIGFKGGGTNLYMQLFWLGATDPSGLCPEPRDDEECCAKAWQDKDIVDNPMVSGMVICCDGRHVTCGRVSPLLPQSRKGNPLVIKCTKEHEQQHIDDGQSPCKQEMPNLERPTATTPVKKQECRARYRQLKCLWRNIDSCGADVECYNTVHAAIRSKITQMDRRRCKGDFNIDTPEDENAPDLGPL